MPVDEPQRPTEADREDTPPTTGEHLDPAAGPTAAHSLTVAGSELPVPVKPTTDVLAPHNDPPVDIAARPGRRPMRRPRIDVGPGPAAVILGGLVLGLAPPIAVAVAAAATTVPVLRWLALPGHLAVLGLGSWVVGILLVARDMMRP